MGPTPSPFLKWLAVSCYVSTAAIAQQLTSVTCPTDDGAQVIKGNSQYELLCGKTIKGLPLRIVPCTDALVCAETCANDSACVHSTYDSAKGECLLKANNVVGTSHRPSWTWRYVGPAPPGSQGQGSQGQGSQGQGTQNPPLGGNTGSGSGTGTGTGTGPGTGTGTGTGTGSSSPMMAANCPADDGKDYTTTNGITYQLKCNHNLAQAVAVRSWTVTSLQHCADMCSQDPQCIAMDFIASNNECYLKATSGPLVAQAGVHSWLPQTCPSSRAMAANVNPAIININTDLKCPQNDGKIFEAADGTWYYLQCCTDTAGAVAIDAVVATSHADCIQQCAANKNCKSATYATWGQTNCKLYGYNKFSTMHIPQIHHAFVTDPPTTAPLASDAKMCSTECPHAHGQLFVSPTGENFQMTCDKRHGTTVLRKERHKTFAACMAACATMPACHSVDYEARTLNCYLTNNVHQPGIAATAFASAHSLGCSGACSSCKDGCDSMTSGGAGNATAAECPADDGGILASGAEDFRISCGVCVHSMTSVTAPGASTLAECAQACANDPTCAAVNYMWAPSVNDYECYMHQSVESDGVTPATLRRNSCDVLVKQSGGMVQTPVSP
ncbi:hypothetical protein PG990_003755 [Apiospora arundinis]